MSIFLVLALVWADKAVAQVCQNECKAWSQCSVWYSDSSLISNASCTNADGVLGVCCPDVVNVHAHVTKIIATSEPSSTRALPVAAAFIEETARSARVDSRHKQQVEEFLSRRNLFMDPDSIAYGHSINMEPTLDASEQAEKGLLMIHAAMRLQDSLRLSTDESVDQLWIDARATSLQETCLKAPICMATKYRSFDGSCNNLRHPNWGRALTPQERLLPPQYTDGVWAEKISYNGNLLPNVRMLSSALCNDEDHPLVGYTHMVMQWGQFIDHDMTHVPVFRTANRSHIDCCTKDGDNLPPEMRHPHCFPIEISPQDRFYGPRRVRCLNFVRSMIAPRTDCRIGYANQMNQLTSFIDGSHIYGVSEEKATALREFSGGRLSVSVINGRPHLPQSAKERGCVRTDGQFCFASGDSRTNQIMGLTALHIVFLRQHNAIADALSSLNRHWNDEVVFQEARRITVALLQHVTYNEYLPAILGRPTMEAYGLTPQTTGYSASYDDQINPSITNEFSTAAYRMGHSMIQRDIHLVEEDGRRRVEPMRKWFDKPHLLRQPGVLDAVLRGLSVEWTQNVDEWVAQDVTNHLFQSAKRDHGFDLISLNLWRGRDHGLGGYTQYRKLCGLPPVATFQQLTAFMNPRVVHKLSILYRSVDEVDLYMGGLLEYHLPNSVLGPVFSCIIGDQFARLKEGDRFFYENGGQPHSFTPHQLQEIRKMSLAAIICDNSDYIMKMQPLVFYDPSPKNPYLLCNSPMFPRMNPMAWKE